MNERAHLRWIGLFRMSSQKNSKEMELFFSKMCNVFLWREASYLSCTLSFFSKKKNSGVQPRPQKKSKHGQEKRTIHKRVEKLNQQRKQSFLSGRPKQEEKKFHPLFFLDFSWISKAKIVPRRLTPEPKVETRTQIQIWFEKEGITVRKKSNTNSSLIRQLKGPSIPLGIDAN